MASRVVFAEAKSGQSPGSHFTQLDQLEISTCSWSLLFKLKSTIMVACTHSSKSDPPFFFLAFFLLLALPLACRLLSTRKF